MEKVDLAELLERELALLDDVDDSDDENTYKEDFLKNRTNDEPKDYAIDEDFNQLLLSAQGLSNLRDDVVPTPRFGDSHVEDRGEETGEHIMDVNNLHAFSTEECTQLSVAKELTEEEKQIITDLMNLMIESVERVAPILGRTELSPLPTVPSPLTLAETPVLTIISDDTQVVVDLPLLEVPAEHHDRKAEIDLIDNRLHNEARLEREAKVTSSQHSDQVMWDETKQFKQAIEQERLRREERQRKREAAKLEARREKAAEQVQRIMRGFLSRRTFTQIQQQHRLTQQQLNAERALQQQRQEEARREQQRLLDLKTQAEECRKMAKNEAYCRKVWEELKALQEKRRLQEVEYMQREEERSAQVRLAIQLARLKMESFALLAAQEDVEYDLFDESDADYSDTESIINGEEEIASIETISRQQSDFNGSQPSSVATTIPATSSLNAQTLSSNKNLSNANTTTKPIYKVVPPKGKPIVSVDPRQGRKFGGALINHTTSSGDNSRCNNNTPHVVDTSDQSNALHSAVGGEVDTVVVGASVQNVNIIQKPPMTAAERQALEGQWQKLVADSHKFTTRNATFDPVGSKVAQDMLTACFAKEDTGLSVHNNSVVNNNDCALISAMRYWQQWYKEYPSTLPAITTATSTVTTTNEPLPTSPDEDAEAPHNSMLDTHADPLLLTELECSVEGIASITFLQKYTNLSKLTLNVNRITQLNGIAALINLHTFSCKDNKLTSIQPLSALTQLKYLYLDANRISDLTPLNGLNNLSVLTVNNNFLCEFPVLQCRSLQRLELCRNKLLSIPTNALRGVPNLVHLNVSSNQITNVCGATLSLCPLLQTLILSENLLSEVPAPLYLPLLKNLRLNLNRIQNLNSWAPTNNINNGNGGSGATIYPLSVPSLQKLVLSDNTIGEIHASVFEMLPLLEECDLSFNAIPNKECIQGITHCKLLHSIHLQDNLFTTVPVNTGAGAGTTRTSLPPNLLTSLLHYVVDLCPTLHTVSGNRLDPKDFSERINATRSVYLRNHYLTHHTYLPHDVLIQDLAYTTHPREVRELIQLLHAHTTQQNILTVKERAVKRDEATAKANNRIHNTNNTENNIPKCDWELESIALFQAQCMQLLSLHSTTNSKDNNTAFVSFAKSVSTNAVTRPAMSVPTLVAPRTITCPEYMQEDAENMHESSDRTSFYLTESASIAVPKAMCTAMHHSSATHLQRLYRGYKLRRRLGTGFKRIKYHDAELDDLFNNEEFNFENEFNDVLDMSYLEEPAMVYGDHIRKRSRPNTGVKPGSTGSIGLDTQSVDVNNSMSSSSGWVLPTDERESPKRPKYNVKDGSGLSNININNAQYNSAYGAGADSRPDTGLSAHTTHSTQQDGMHTPYSDAPDRAARSFQSGASSPAHSMLSARSNVSGISEAHSARPKVTAAALGQEWGISDPRVLASMLKRSNKIRVAEDVKERRELEKDPLYRLQQFQKTAHTHKAVQPANTRTSGSFGGAPKTMRGAGGNNTKRKNMPLPAWMLGGGAAQEGEES